MTLRVSIIVNNFNYAEYIAPCIESAITQTYRNIEVIVSDDGSTDNSRAIIELRIVHYNNIQAQRRTSFGIERRL